MGPNVKKLLIRRMTVILVPPGGVITPLHAALVALTDPDKMESAAKVAYEWVQAALAAVKAAPDNPYEDDEAIAAAVLTKLEETNRSKT